MLGEAEDAGFAAGFGFASVQVLQTGKDGFLFAFHQSDSCLRGVVLIAHAGGKGLFIRLQGPEDAAGQGYFRMQDGLQHFLCDAAGPENRGDAVAEIQHRGFHADLTGAAVQNQGDFSLQILQHMGCQGGAWPAGGIGGRRRDRQSAGFQHGCGHRMGRHPHGHRRETCGYLRGNGGLPVKQNGQGPRPESVHQRQGLFRYCTDFRKLGAVMDMNDQRIVGGPALGGKNRQNSLCVQGIGPETIDGFRRKGNQFACAEQIRRQGQGFLRRGEQKRFQGKSHSFRSIKVSLRRKSRNMKHNGSGAAGQLLTAASFSVFSARRRASIKGPISPFMTFETRFTVMDSR